METPQTQVQQQPGVQPPGVQPHAPPPNGRQPQAMPTWDPAPRPPAGHVPSLVERLPPPASPQRPHYRERRPVRWWSVLVGVGVTLVYFVLVGLVSWSPGSFVTLLLVAVLLAAGVVSTLVSRGDRGIGVGVAMVTGAALGVTITVFAWGAFDLGSWVSL
jgi:hypothetical protein